jgi:hypothetical protein
LQPLLLLLLPESLPLNMSSLLLRLLLPLFLTFLLCLI